MESIIRTDTSARVHALQAENEELRRRLEEAEETIEAIQSGAIDALVISGPDGPSVYTLEGADRPYRLLVEKMQQGAATLQADGTIVYANQSLADLLKIPHEKLIGGNFRSFVALDDVAVYENLLRQGKTRSGRGDALLQRMDGVEVPVFLTFNVLPRDCGADVGVLVTDLTTQRHHEQLTAAHAALRQSQQMEAARRAEFEALLNAVPAAICVAHDAECRRITGNPAAGVLVRMPPDQNMSMSAPAEEMPQHVRTYRDGVLLPIDELPMQKAARTGQTLPNQELELRFADGTIKWAIGNALPLFDHAGKVRGAIASFVDITQRKLAEEALKEGDRRKDEFLAMLAHELRNPLAPICNAMQILQTPACTPKDRAYFLEMIDRQLTQIVRLVDDLMEISRITRGKITLRKEPIDLSTAIRSAVETSKPLIDSMGHQLTINSVDEPVVLNADPVRLAQVLANLLNNAAKYTSSGGQIALTTRREGAHVVLSVRDNGMGIAAEMLPRIFDLFIQTNRAYDRAQGGLGIGLTLVRNLVELHGGGVEAKSDGLGKGSEFIVRLPAPATLTAPLPQPPAPVTKSRLVGRRILVVDDNQDAAQTLATILKGLGNETRFAFDGLEAVQITEQFRPEIVLMDVGMPKLNGYDAARRIRQQPWGMGVILVAITGWGHERDRQLSRQAGFDAHLVKPIDTAAIEQMLATKSEHHNGV